MGANDRAACRAKSTADFIYKMKIVEEEVDESMFFLEVFMEIHDKNQKELKRLHKEGNELLSITVASINTARNRQSEKS